MPRKRTSNRSPHSLVLPPKNHTTRRHDPPAEDDQWPCVLLDHLEPSMTCPAVFSTENALSTTGEQCTESTGSSGASSSETPGRTCETVLVHTKAARMHLIRAYRKGRCVKQHSVATTTEDKCNRRTDHTDTLEDLPNHTGQRQPHPPTFPRLHSSFICSGAREKHRRNRSARPLHIVTN